MKEAEEKSPEEVLMIFQKYMDEILTNMERCFNIECKEHHFDI
jgi:hypothetical protein